MPNLRPERRSRRAAPGRGKGQRNSPTCRAGARCLDRSAHRHLPRAGASPGHRRRSHSEPD